MRQPLRDGLTLTVVDALMDPLGLLPTESAANALPYTDPVMLDQAATV